MDFLALPRRDLQALCKRNGVRANMTNAAMAEALAALPTVDGIEEYIKQPVLVRAPAAKAVVAEEEEEVVVVEPRLEKQGSPLPRGRRVTAKRKEPSKTKDAKQADATREQNTEDAPAHGVGRRGASRRARPAPAVPKPSGKAPTEEEKPGSSSLADAHRVEDGEAEEDLKVEGNKENVHVPVVGRRGASHRGRAVPAGESGSAVVVEKRKEKEESQVPRGRRGAVKLSEKDDHEETEKEDIKQKASTDEAPAHGVGRCGPSRRARPAAAIEEMPAPIPRGRNLKDKSTEPIKPNGSEEVGKPEKEADVPAPVVGRRGASRRARAAPAVALPAGNAAAEEEPTAPILGSLNVRVKYPEVITLDDSEEDEKEDTNSEEKVEALPAIGVARAGASRRAPALAEAPATRRRVATSKPDAGDVAVEAVPIRSARQRKPPTMKAVAAAEEKAPGRAPRTRRGAVRETFLQQEEQEEPKEDLPAPVSEVVFDNPEDSEEASGPQKREQKQDVEDLVIFENEILMEEVPAQELLVTEKECVDHSTLQEQAADVENCPAPLVNQEDSPILGLITMSTEIAAEKDEGGNFQDVEGLLDKELCEEICDAGEEMEIVSTIQGLQPPQTEEVVADDDNHEIEMRNFNELLHCTEETGEASSEDFVSQDKEDNNIDELQADLADGSVLVDCSVNTNLFAEEETSEVNTEEGVSFQEKGDVSVDVTLPNTVAEAICSGCSSDCLVEVEKAGDITNDMPGSPVSLDEDGEERILYSDIFQANRPNEDVIGDSVSQVKVTDNQIVQEEKVVVIIDEMPRSTSAMHEHVEEDQFKTDVIRADELKEVVTIDEVPELTGTDGEVVEVDKTVVITDELPQCTGTMDEDVEEDQFQTVFVHADQEVTADLVPDLKIVSIIQGLQAPQTEEQIEEVIADDGNHELLHGTEETSEASSEDFVSEDKEDINIDELQANLADGSVLVDCSGNANLFAEEEASEVNTEGFSFQGKVDVSVDVTLPNTVAQASDISLVEVENAGDITNDMPEDDEETNCYSDIFQANKTNEEVIGDSVSQVKVTDTEIVQVEKVVGITDEMPWSTSVMHEHIEEDQFQTDVIHAGEQKEVVTIDEVPELTGTDGEVFKEDMTVVITDELPQSTDTMNVDQDVFVHADQDVTAEPVPDLKIKDSEVIEEETALIIDENQQSTDTMGVGDRFETDAVHADEQKEVVIPDKVPQLTWIESEVVEEDKAVLIADEVPHSTGTMDECVWKIHSEIGFIQDGELNNAITTDNIPEVIGTDGAAINTFTCDLPEEVNTAQESNYHITAALLDNVTESLCKSTIFTESLCKSIITVEPTISVSEGTSVCNNSIEKNTIERPVAMLEEKGVKVDKKSVDLTKLSLGQLRTKLKETLIAKKNKEAKRVALARVDENVCRSHSKGQQQNLNLQQH
ncbi:unnamed protein product [Urochloa humidicola]